ncbi:hypothetical protein ACO0LG_01105 [Undibacterium sp. Ji42W]|uniref:hypothetical protein n=1 Tax=Undibacterium sp. Ji42W TaxID=3413039 RepID=UPI003BF3207A
MKTQKLHERKQAALAHVRIVFLSKLEYQQTLVHICIELKQWACDGYFVIPEKT